MAHTVYIAMGTNLGDRGSNLRQALAWLSPAVHVRRVSPIYETRPWGVTDQPDFYNQVVAGETDLEPLALLDELKQLETRLGRQPSVRYGPRLIDLDILAYDDLTFDHPRLVIPHPRMAERAFVLTPLCDLAPDLRHPRLGKTVAELLAESDRSGVKRLEKERTRRLFPTGWGQRTLVMGIINLTPDSFSGDGLLNQGDLVHLAVSQARRFVGAGADILDLGGESTRPGSAPVTAQEELERVLPVLDALLAEDLPAILSIDTSKAAVAEAALAMGADWINDVWALRADPDMAAVVARYGAPVVLMHNRLKPNSAEIQERLGGRYIGVHYDDLLADIKGELMESVALARAAGVADERVILDPGIGFGKTVEQNLELLDRLDEIRALGFPVLLGPSRKSFIGFTLNLPADQRVEGTAAAVAVGIVRGADIVRVHDVEVMTRVARMTDAIVRRPGSTRV